MSAIKNKPVLLLSAALLVFMSGIAYAQGPVNEEGKPPMHQEKLGGHGPMIPDLTDAQKEQIKDLQIEHMKAMKPLQNEIREKEAHLQTLQVADKVNMSEINKVIENIGQLRIQIMKLNAAHHQEIRSLLTEEQRVFFDVHQPPHDRPDMPRGPR